METVAYLIAAGLPGTGIVILAMLLLALEGGGRLIEMFRRSPRR